MRRRKRRILAAGMVVVITCSSYGSVPRVYANTNFYQIREIESLSEQVLYQKVPYGTRYQDLEMPDSIDVFDGKMPEMNEALKRHLTDFYGAYLALAKAEEAMNGVTPSASVLNAQGASSIWIIWWDFRFRRCCGESCRAAVPPVASNPSR